MILAVRVTALLFARLREQAGGERFDLELPAGATVAAAYDDLRSRHPRRITSFTKAIFLPPRHLALSTHR